MNDFHFAGGRRVNWLARFAGPVLTCPISVKWCSLPAAAGCCLSVLPGKRFSTGRGCREVVQNAEPTPGLRRSRSTEYLTRRPGNSGGLVSLVGGLSRLSESSSCGAGVDDERQCKPESHSGPRPYYTNTKHIAKLYLDINNVILWTSRLRSRSARILQL